MRDVKIIVAELPVLDRDPVFGTCWGATVEDLNISISTGRTKREAADGMRISVLTYFAHVLARRIGADDRAEFEGVRFVVVDG